MKKIYATPDADITMFSSEDIITTSMVGDGTQSIIDEINGLDLG